MAVNKVVYGGETLIDLTNLTVAANTLDEGVTAVDASGAMITGTGSTRLDEHINNTNNPHQVTTEQIGLTAEQIRTITVSTEAPSGGNDGDIWIVVS
jgi:hypothetical protein